MLQIYTAILPASSNLIPLAILALLISSGIISIWYIIGFLLANEKIKQSAIGEFTQIIGTLIIIAIVIYALTVLSGVLYTSLNSTHAMNQGTISSLCSGIEKNNGIFTGLSILSEGSGSLLGSSNPKYPGLCYYIQTGSSSVSTRIDYPLAAAGVIDANITSQVAQQLNYLSIVDSYIGFFSKFSVTTGIGLGIPEVSGSISPDAGFAMVYDAMRPLGTLMSLGLEFNIATLIILTIALYSWPYLIFGGIILRSIIFTRKIGGLLIAVAIGMVFIYPTILSIEYITLSNSASYGNLAAYTSTYGPNAVIAPGPITANSIILSNTIESSNAIKTEPYNLDFFVLPSIAKTAEQDGCWPILGNIGLAESEQIGLALVPIVSQVNLILAFTGGSIPDTSIQFSGCSESSVEHLTFDIFDIYGISGIIMYWIPIINILITLSSIIGISGLMGGDTSLAGLGKLI